MKRAILVSTGTLAGLAAVLTYSGGDQIPAVAAAPAAGGGGGSVVGAPPPLDTSASASASPTDSASASASLPAAAPAASTPAAAAPAATPAAAAPAPAAVPAAATPAAPAPAPTAAAPKPVVTPKPTPKPTPTPTKAVAQDFLGSLQTHKYGQVQVGIRVLSGKIIAVWAQVAPSGASQPYTDFSVPVFKTESMAAQGTNIANVSGATLTWQSWKTSMQAAMSKAGL